MLQKRTDLAAEARQLWNESAGKKTKLEGVEAFDSTREGFNTTVVKIIDQRGEKALGKPCGTYVTLEVERRPDDFLRAARALAAELTELIKLPPKAETLVVGLGNIAITPDSVGPRAMEYTMVTRHLSDNMPDVFGHMRRVSALSPGVLGTTGLESSEIVRGVAQRSRPELLLVIDALASRSLDRVCSTIQLADTGIVPGSGVGNARAAFNKETLGVPVIAIGVPTVVDAATLAADIAAEAGAAELDPEALRGKGGDLIVTPKEIDSYIRDISKIIGYGINMALHEGITPEEITSYLS